EPEVGAQHCCEVGGFIRESPGIRWGRIPLSIAAANDVLCTCAVPEKKDAGEATKCDSGDSRHDVRLRENRSATCVPCVWPRNRSTQLTKRRYSQSRRRLRQHWSRPAIGTSQPRAP